MEELFVCNDIEYACDERVIKRLEREERKAYTKALLSCSMGHRMMLFCPPSFVRNSVKKRVRSVVNFKKATIPVLCLAVVVCVIVAVTFLTDRRQGGDYAIELNGAELSEKTAELIAEEIVELMQESEKGIYRLENFSFTFYELESEQENKLLRVSVEADSTLVREPGDSPLIQGMKKAQSELTYEAERTFAQTMIDSMFAQLEVDREERICEPVIFVALDEKGNYELTYGDAERTPLKDYFKKENAEQEEILGYLTVYQRAGIQPPMDTVGSSGYVYSRALENPENQVVNYAAYVSGISVNQSFLYYGDSVYDDIASYEVKDKEKLPWELLGDEIKVAYSNNGRYWSERDKLTECTGHGTIYQVKGYEDSYLVALVYARDFPTGSYGMSSWESTPYKQRVFHRDDVLEDGVDPTYCVILCERMNDLWFHEGREVFSKRLHLENAVAVKGLSMEEELLWNFLAELNEATFIQQDTTDLSEFSELASQTITFTDAVGVKHSLILYEGGYVVKQACNTRLIAKIEEETCRRVMERIQAYEAEQPKVSFEHAFPVEMVWNREEGYEEVYEEFLERVRGHLFNENFLPFWGDEDGYYVSGVPLYDYDVQHEVLSDGTSLLVLSKEFDRSGLFWFHLSLEEPSVAYRSWPQEILELMKEQPSEEFIFLDMAPGLAVLDERNVIRWNSALNKNGFTPEEGLYQKLYSDELAVSYEELTAKENLLWVPVKEEKMPDVTVTPKVTPVSEEVLKTIKLPLMGEECTFKVLGKKRADMDIYGVREIILYTGGEPYQSILVQEAIDADGVDGIDKGYTECPHMEDTVNLKDVNFDGYPDLEVWGWSPNNSIPYYYWCWNPETLQFEYAFCLQLTDIDTERKHLISYTKAGGGVYYMERYRVTKENKLELAERMTEDYRTFMNWQEAYRDVIYNFPDNMTDLNNPYATRDTSDWTNTEKKLFLGILDFDADGTPELLIGDTVSLAVFTYRNEKVEKCTEVILPNGFNRIDDAGFKENAVIVNCYGASAFGHAAVTYRDGKWINATCSNADGEIFINGKKATCEDWNAVMPLSVDEWGSIEKLGSVQREYRNRVVKEEDGTYALYPWTSGSAFPYYEMQWAAEGIKLDETFDFEQIRWSED